MKEIRNDFALFPLITPTVFMGSPSKDLYHNMNNCNHFNNWNEKSQNVNKPFQTNKTKKLTVNSGKVRECIKLWQRNNEETDEKNQRKI